MLFSPLFPRVTLFNAGSEMEPLCRLIYVRDQGDLFQGSLDTSYDINHGVKPVKLLQKKNGLRYFLFHGDLQLAKII